MSLVDFYASLFCLFVLGSSVCCIFDECFLARVLDSADYCLFFGKCVLYLVPIYVCTSVFDSYLYV